MKADEEVANEQARAAQAIKDECDRDLGEALPVLEAALAALDTLTSNVCCAEMFSYPPLESCFQEEDSLLVPCLDIHAS